MTCAHAVRRGFQKIDGVEAVEIGLTRGSGQVRLRPGNRARVEAFWKVVWGNGNKPRETKIVANGEITQREGRTYFRLPENGVEYLVSGEIPQPGRVRLRGILTPPPDRKTAPPLEVQSSESLR